MIKKWYQFIECLLDADSILSAFLEIIHRIYTTTLSVQFSLVTQSCPTLCNPMDCSPQAPLSMGFSRQEYWSGLPCPPPGDRPHPAVSSSSLMSPALAGGFFTTSATWEAQATVPRVTKSQTQLKQHSMHTHTRVCCPKCSLTLLDLGFPICP